MSSFFWSDLIELKDYFNLLVLYLWNGDFHFILLFREIIFRKNYDDFQFAVKLYFNYLYPLISEFVRTQL